MRFIGLIKTKNHTECYNRLDVTFNGIGKQARHPKAALKRCGSAEGHLFEYFKN